MSRAFSIKKLNRTFGALIEGIKLTDLKKCDIEELYELWLEHSLLVFPNQHLSNRQQIEFAKLFGEMEFDITPISNVRSDGSVRDPIDDDIVKSLRGNMEWHHDSTYMPIQAKGSVFTAHLVPTKGGETGWADMTAAYEALDNPMKNKIKDLSAYHSYTYSQAKYKHKPQEESEFSGYGFDVDPHPFRPLVKTHPETGKKSLLIGRHAYGIPGMTEEESKALLDELNDFACQGERIYHHSWKVGDAVIWDNRNLMHQACSWDLTQARVMYHSRIQGEPATESGLNYL
tara:strand:+ start:854 stop:1714 length:861 start_codon:yes stop_codon:yes gene_type:complete